MAFRVTPSRQYQLGLAQAQRQTAELTRVSTNISSGLRLHKPSDDPLAQKRVLDQKAVLSHFEAQSEIIRDSRTVLNETHNQLRSAQQLVVKAKEAALQGRQALDSSEAQVYARDIRSVLESVKQIALSRHDGRYLFSGLSTQTQPFAEADGQFVYQGASQSAAVSVDGAEAVTVHHAGNKVFSTGQAGQTVVRGTTGAKGGPGTASGFGFSQLMVQHTTTIFSGTSGIQPGDSSAANDTVIGPAGTHTLEIIDTSGTGTVGTVSLNGGAPVSFSSADTDLRVAGPDGEVVFVNTSAITPGFSGTVDLTADGTLSLDGGATQIPIDFSENQQLTDAAGNIRHIDSRDIRATGTDEVSTEGHADLFETLSNLEKTLTEFDSLEASERDYRVGQAIEELQTLSDHLLDVVGEQSVDLATLDRMETRSEDRQLETQKLLTEIESTDLPEAVLKLQELQNLSQYTIATLARVQQVSVLDFLR